MSRLFPSDAFANVARFIPREMPSVFIDAGAHVGRMSERLCTLFPRAIVYAFEPVDATFVELKARSVSCDRIVPVRAALGSHDGVARINVNGCPGTSSVFESAERVLRYHGDNLVTRRVEETPMLSLDLWAARAGVDGIEFLKIDVQGYELEVLKGARGLLTSTIKAVYSEAQLVALYEGAALYTDLDLYLRGHGFEMYQIHEIFSNGEEERTTCCDALWVRSDVLSAYVDSVAMRRRSASG